MLRKYFVFLLFFGVNVAGAVGNRLDLTVYDRTERRTLPVYYYEGRYYVSGRPGNQYQLELRNQSGERLLAVISVDGVNVISGETASPAQSGYVLQPRDRLPIKGWRKSLDRIATFYFTELSDAYATRTDRPNNVGVIGVAVFQERRWRYKEDEVAQDGAAAAPKSAASAERRATEKSSQLGTGHGRSESSRASTTTFERESEEPAEVITLYYDSYANLVRRGIIPEQNRHPDPFPSRFVPDPR